MTDASWVLPLAVSVTCVAPLALFFSLALPSLAGRGIDERITGALTRLALVVALLASLVGLFGYLLSGAEPMVLSYGNWFGSGHASFAFDFAIDGMSLAFVVLALAICNVVAAFSFRYLHREPGFHRYFIQVSMFVEGIVLVALAGSIEVLFVGWELLGLSSALLVGYFHERRAPVQNALRVFGVYRASDAAMLSAAVLLHHFSGSGELSHLFMRGAQTPVVLESAEAFTISVLIIIAVAGKSALWPFSGWLPRAMEGPTPSSAIYYGALSIHAGCYLLLRAEPLIGQSLAARGIVVFLGLTTALYAGITTRVQTDVKSALSFAALTQVGIIVIEIGLGLTTLALVHIAGHATFRLLQFLTAPNVLHDLHQLEQRVGASTASEEPRALDRWLGKTLYLVALERGFADSLVELAIVRPFCRVAASLDRLDRWLTGSSNLGSGGPS